MAKVQKTFYLNEELDQLIDAASHTTGASFTKIITAALISYFLRDYPGPPKPESMKLAVSLEKGDLKLSGVLVSVLRNRGDQLQKRLDDDIKLGVFNKDHINGLIEDRQRWSQVVEDFEDTFRKSSAPLEDVIHTIITRRLSKE